MTQGAAKTTHNAVPSVPMNGLTAGSDQGAVVTHIWDVFNIREWFDIFQDQAHIPNQVPH